MLHGCQSQSVTYHKLVYLLLFHRYEEYEQFKRKIVAGPSQPGIVEYAHALPQERYGLNHPQQKAINDAIFEDLIVGLNLALTITEHKKFRHFMSVVDCRFVAGGYRSVYSTMVSKAATTRTKLKEILNEAEHLSLTVDIWSDRRMRGFLGITVHILSTTKGLRLESSLLACSRFKGSHTGEKIAEAFEAICNEYNIRHKLDFVICDNAANMKKAFSICFPQEEEQDQVNDEDNLDDPDIWEELPVTEQDFVEQVND